jgi:hypothetical protein
MVPINKTYRYKRSYEHKVRSYHFSCFFACVNHSHCFIIVLMNVLDMYPVSHMFWTGFV